MRMTTRRWMIAVAVVAVALGAVQLWRRSREFSDRAEALYECGWPHYQYDPECSKAENERGLAMYRYYWHLIHKYRRAARYPWLPVPPDPPAPEENRPG